MRKKLHQLGSKERHRFHGTFVRTGYKRFMRGSMEYARYSPTFLLKDVYLDDQFMTDHLWMNYGIRFVRLGRLGPHDQVAFDARVDTYSKGHYPYLEHDYKLTYPTKVHLLENDNEHSALPADNHALVGYIMLQNKDFYINNGRPYDSYFVERYHEWERKQA